MKEWIHSIVKYAAEKPSDFLCYVLLVTLPLFGLSAFLSVRLANKIEQQKKKVKKIDKIIEGKKKKKQ